MSNGLVQRKSLQPNSHYDLGGQLIRHIDRMEYNARVAKCGMHELGEIHSYAESTVSKTLLEAEKLDKEMSQQQATSPEQQRAYQIRRQQFLEHINELTGRAGEQVLLDIGNAPGEQRQAMFNRLYDLFRASSPGD